MTAEAKGAVMPVAAPDKATRDDALAAAASVHLQEVVKVYPDGRRALDGVELDILPGELFGLLGPNGAGKTTTVGICSTMVVPTAGVVRVAGLDIGTQPALVRRVIGAVSAENSLDSSLTVAQNIAYHCRYFGFSRARARQRTDELLRRFDLADRGDAEINTLSTGLAKRLQIARAIAHDPRVLFLDEPTAGLDPQSRLGLWDQINLLRKRTDATVLLTTHYIEEAERYCDRVAIIDHGRIIACDTPRELRRQYGSAAVLDVTLDRANEAARLVAGIADVVSVDATEHGLRVLTTHPAELMPALAQELQPHGVKAMSVSEPGLETVFIELTGRSLRD